MASKEELKRATSTLKDAREERRRRRRKYLLNRAEDVSRLADQLKPSLRERKQTWQTKILEHPHFHPELVDSRDGMREILGGLVSEEEYTQCLAWLLSQESAFAQELLTRILQETHAHRKEEPAEILGEFTVRPEHWIDRGCVDILIRSRGAADLLILIENKVLPGTHEGFQTLEDEEEEKVRRQLEIYESWAMKQDVDHLFLLFLCLGEQQMTSSDTGFRVLRWNRLVRLLKELLDEIPPENSLVDRVAHLFVRDVARFISPVSSFKSDLEIMWRRAQENQVADLSLHRFKTIHQYLEDRRRL